MYHLVNNLTNAAGDALVGYYVKLKDGSGNYATLYSDENLTPIATVSGLANAAKTDSDGMYDIYVDDGTYDVEFFDKTETTLLVKRIPAVPMYSNTSTAAVFARLADTTAGEGAALVVLEDGTDLQAAVTAKVATADLASTASGKGAALVGVKRTDTGSVARTLADVVNVMPLTPQDFGAAGEGSGDDTAEIEAMFDAITGSGATGPYRVEWPHSGYNVTQIRLDTSGVHHDFKHAIITGIATAPSPKKSTVDIRAGGQWVNDLKVYGSFLASAVYECGVHHYTNNLSLYNPTEGDIGGLHVEAFDLGLCLGALPSQGSADASSAAQLADDLAINAPLSELTYTNPRIKSCPKGILMSQPNGKISMWGARAHSECDAWASYYTGGSYTALAADTYCVQVADAGSELALVGGTIEHVQGGDNGACLKVTAGLLTVRDAALETTVPHYVSGSGELRLANIHNNGLNSSTRAYVEVESGATGRFSISDCPINWVENIHASAAAAVTAVASLKGANAIAADFEAEVRNVQLKGIPFSLTGSSYRPLTRGVRSRFRDCVAIAYDGTNTGTETYRYRLNEGPNLLAGIAEPNAALMPTAGGAVTGVYGGWTITPTGSYSAGQDTTGLPTVKGETFHSWIKIQGGGAGTVTMTMTSYAPIKPGELNLLRGFIKASGAGSMYVKVYYYLANGSAASTASVEMFNGLASQFGSTAQPFVLAFVPPVDATKCKLEFYAGNNCDLYVTNLTLT